MAVKLAPRAGLTVTGFAFALGLRLAVAQGDGSGSALAGLTFAFVLIAVAVAAGWRPSVPRRGSVFTGVLGAAGLVMMPLGLRLTGRMPSVAFPPTAFPLWAVVVTVVAVAEEILLRGVLFSMLETLYGPIAAVGAAAVLFGLVHVPLYGWAALPLDLAVGVWLGGLRVVTGTSAAPAVAHALADLIAWWMM